uniref:Uncharacterized protein n=1 Tax=Lepeophtheirus salmonis TaxID=72036 RepID=A0A0K2SW60_LEPSM
MVILTTLESPSTSTLVLKALPRNVTIPPLSNGLDRHARSRATSVYLFPVSSWPTV